MTIINTEAYILLHTVLKLHSLVQNVVFEHLWPSVRTHQKHGGENQISLVCFPEKCQYISNTCLICSF